jgi:hypothetical protein
MVHEDLSREKLNWIIENVDEMFDFDTENENKHDTY